MGCVKPRLYYISLKWRRFDCGVAVISKRKERTRRPLLVTKNDPILKNITKLCPQIAEANSKPKHLDWSWGNFAWYTTITLISHPVRTFFVCEKNFFVRSILALNFVTLLLLSRRDFEQKYRKKVQIFLLFFSKMILTYHDVFQQKQTSKCNLSTWYAFSFGRKRPFESNKMSAKRHLNSITVDINTGKHPLKSVPTSKARGLEYFFSS